MEIEIENDTMLAAYLIDPARRTYDLVELAADAGIGLSDQSRAALQAPDRESEDDEPQLELGEESRRRWSHRRRPGWSPSSPSLRPSAWRSGGWTAFCATSSCRWSRCWRRWSARGSSSTPSAWRRSARDSRRRSRSCSPRSTSWPGREFTIGSPQQVGEVLFDDLGLTRKRRGKTGFSTDARVLGQIRDEHEIVPKIESWRELTKLKSTYLDTLPDLIDPKTKRIHTTFNQAATTTGRLSSTNPNLQNIPIRTELGRPLRSCFVAERGARLLSADYSQVELRVLAQVADEEVLKKIFREGDDVHAATASEVFEIPREEVDVGQRSKAKMVNFGIVYGLTGFGLADRLGDPAGRGRGVRRPLPGALPGGARLPRADDRARPGGGLRDDPDGTPPPDPGAALQPAADAPARRAARREHRDPGHRGGHHQGGDGALSRGACRSRS